MIKVLLARLQQGHRTMAYPAGAPPELPARFRGRPIIDASKCPPGCEACAEACPTEAITFKPNHAGAPGIPGATLPVVDLGRCLFCTECMRACPQGAVTHSPDYRLATRTRDDLVTDGQTLKLADALDGKLRRLLGRSLKLREVSAGGCAACDLDVNVLNTVGWDLSRFGIQFVASPRHADGLLITGPVTHNMKAALLETYAATPNPRIVIVVGACAISGGIYRGHPETNDGVGALLPVDLYIPGCPPHPLTILDGLLRLLGQIHDTGRLPTPPP